jgi:phenylalanyl-tRNA synthetase beta chain
MKILLSWLNEFLSDNYTCQQVVDALFQVGIEVEYVEEMGKGLDNVIVARIDEFRKHPDADKLSLCKVFDGQSVLDIVCGAKNFKAGDHVALAQIGAVLPNGLKIQKSKIRGEVSFGMLCSKDELGMSGESDGILILDKSLEPGMPLKQALSLNDAVLHLSLTPNRGDCFSILGIAIEVAAALNVKVMPPIKSMSKLHSMMIPCEVVDSEVCPKYTLQKIEGVTVAPSSSMISQRLEKSGTKSLSNVVDVTNYLMLERGQPMHAFDADKIEGKIQVRFAKKGETIECLDDVTRHLEPEDLLIADERGPIGIAGIMGGKRTAISTSTKNVLLEGALFDPKTIRTTSRRLGLVTESSKRFEREVDPSSVLETAMMAASMIEETSQSKIIGGIDFDSLKLKAHKIHLTQKNIQTILGQAIPNAGDHLSRLGFTLEKMDDGWRVEVPYRRPEIQREIDLIEEVARIHGYTNLPSRLPSIQIEPKVDSTFSKVEGLRQKAIAFGLLETRLYSFTSKTWAKVFSKDEASWIHLQNPLTAEMSVMRNSLLPGLLDCWKFNSSRQCNGAAFFEIGKVFGKSEKDVREKLMISAMWAGTISKKTWSENSETKADYFHGKGFIEYLLEQYRVTNVTFDSKDLPDFLHAGKAAAITIGKRRIGYVGQLHPSLCRTMGLESDICIVEMEADMLLEMSLRKPKFAQFSSFPKVERDLALIFKKTVQYGQVREEIQKLNPSWMTQMEVFDRFDGKGIPVDSVSFAYRFTFQSPEKTLTDQEVESSMKSIADHLQAKFEAKVRS